MNQHIDNPRDFRTALAVGERLYSMYKFNQTGSTPISVPELCNYYDIGKMKIYELLRGEKYKYPVKEEAEKKPVWRIQPEKVEEPPEKSKKTKAAPTTWTTVHYKLTNLRSFSGLPIPPKENMNWKAKI